MLAANRQYLIMEHGHDVRLHGGLHILWRNVMVLTVFRARHDRRPSQGTRVMIARPIYIIYTWRELCASGSLFGIEL